MTLSNEARGEVFGQEGGGFLACLTISHDDLATPIRVVNNNVNIVQNGETFLAYPFKLSLPDDIQTSAPRAKLSIDNVSRELAQLIRSISTPPDVLIEIVRIDDFDSVEMTLPTFRLRNVEWDALQISGDLTIDEIEKEPFPQRRYTPAEFPGLF